MAIVLTVPGDESSREFEICWQLRFADLSLDSRAEGPDIGCRRRLLQSGADQADFSWDAGHDRQVKKSWCGTIFKDRAFAIHRKTVTVPGKSLKTLKAAPEFRSSISDLLGCKVTHASFRIAQDIAHGTPIRRAACVRTDRIARWS